MLGELAGGGFVALAVGASDMRQVTGDLQHVTPYHFFKGNVFFCICSPAYPHMYLLALC